jgi:hypothetical protein
LPFTFFLLPNELNLKLEAGTLAAFFHTKPIFQITPLRHLRFQFSEWRRNIFET